MIEKHIFEKTKKLSILFIEDNEPFRTRMATVLEDYFYRVDIAVDGLDGIGKYNDFYLSKQKHYDLVVSDIRMPMMNGVELTAKLRAIREEQPIIILSAYAESNFLLPLINLGIAQFITKPVRYSEMFDTLYKVCSKINLNNSSLLVCHSHRVSLSRDVYWDSGKKLLQSDEGPISLTRYEILLMALLTTKYGQVCSTEEILNYFYYANIDISPDNLRGLMRRLRKKLPNNVLSSIYGIGYRLASIK